MHFYQTPEPTDQDQKLDLSLKYFDFYLFWNSRGEVKTVFFHLSWACLWTLWGERVLIEDTSSVINESIYITDR